MHPWLLYDVRKDDIDDRYKRAERHRLAAEIPKGQPRASSKIRTVLTRASLAVVRWIAVRVEADSAARTTWLDGSRPTVCAPARESPRTRAGHDSDSG